MTKCGITTGILFALIMTGCTGPNTSLRTIQLSSAPEPLPANYQSITAAAISDLPSYSEGSVTLSEPRKMIGDTAISPHRWYVCANGLKSPRPKPTGGVRPAVNQLTEWVFPPKSSGRYDVIAILNGDHKPTIIKTFDSPLCD